ncbi:hypothetical protein BAUCODRAFT_112294, partial [Baudoinia panamericana UAMH 10762]
MDGQTSNTRQPTSSSSSRRRRRSRGKPTWLGWTFDKALKVFVWYALITVLFRCPSEQKDIKEGTPALCKPYLQTRDHVTPYAKPYYDDYVAPQLQKVQPYIDQVNTRVVDPGVKAYRQHGAPIVTRAQKQAVVQWQKTIKPQLEVARQQAGKQYDIYLSPHVKRVQDVVQPYYDSVRTSATDIWELEVEPVYRNTAPYAQKLLTQGQAFAVKTLLPQARYAGTAAWAFGAKQIWPRMQVLYGENIEPQLLRIRERLGRYRDEKRLQAEVKSMDVVTEAPVSAVKDATSSASSAASSLTPTEHFHEDLQAWERACSKAVEEGAEHLRTHLAEIASHQTATQANTTGHALLTQLEDTVSGTLNSVKARILSIVASLPEDAEQVHIDEAKDSLKTAIRNAGQNVKSAAQAIRDWKAQTNAETDDLVTKALQSTLETIDSIREIRLAEIGRKYADAGLPHKEWSAYNELKKSTKLWRDDVENVVDASTELKGLKEAVDEVEGKGMSVAEECARELGRLKEVGGWKIEAGDGEDNFSSKQMPPAAERARKKVVDTASDASEAVLGSKRPEEGSFESVTSAAAGQASSLSSSASEAVYGSTGTVESLTNKAKESASSLADG